MKARSKSRKLGSKIIGHRSRQMQHRWRGARRNERVLFFIVGEASIGYVGGRERCIVTAFIRSGRAASLAGNLSPIV